MKLEQIKACVDAGLKVHWKDSGYVVCRDSGSASGYSIAYDWLGPAEDRIGLTWNCGVRVNGDPDDFYVTPLDFSTAVDDAAVERNPRDTIGKRCRYVGFGGFWVAVFSYYGAEVDADEACELAIDLLLEKNWFADETQTAPHIVI